MLEKIVAWRSRRISDRHFTLLLSLFVGFFAAVAGYVLHLLIHQIQLLLTSGFDVSGINWLYLLFPVVGMPPSGRTCGATTHGLRWWHRPSPSASEGRWEPRRLSC